MIPAFIIRVKFMAKPGEEFILRREVYRRLQERSMPTASASPRGASSSTGRRS